MGNRLCSKKKRRSSISSSNSDLDKLSTLNFPLQFKVVASNFKAMNIKMDNFYLDINFFNIEKYKSKVIYHQKDPEFNFNKSFMVMVYSKD